MQSPSQASDFGFLFHPSVHPHDPGHPRLDVFLKPSPTDKYIDPEQVHFSAISQHDEIERMSVDFKWEGPKEGRICAGRVILKDRHDKTVEAFTFGGQFTIEPTSELTTCTIKSQAPILEMISEQSVSMILALEVEILLAERRAAWASDPDAYERRLVSANPLSLYHSCLDEIREKFSHLPHAGNNQIQAFWQFLNKESRELHDIYQLPEISQPLKDLI